MKNCIDPKSAPISKETAQKIVENELKSIYM